VVAQGAIALVTLPRRGSLPGLDTPPEIFFERYAAASRRDARPFSKSLPTIASMFMNTPKAAASAEWNDIPARCQRRDAREKFSPAPDGPGAAARESATPRRPVMRTSETFVLSLGFVAAAVTTSAWVPQAWKTVKSRSAKDFSWSSLAMLVVGIGLWLGYGVLRRDGAIVGANLVTLLLVLVIAAVKRRHG